MSICNECWGKGWIEKQGVQFDCRKCKGTGVIENEPMTNEEWFCGLETEEKAKWLSRHSQFMYGCGQMETTPKIMYEEDWEYWLKEKHE